ncbi:hypothetical protein ACXKR8_000525 [Streptacidiphilus sp. PAMC 29251]
MCGFDEEGRVESWLRASARAGWTLGATATGGFAVLLFLAALDVL